MTFREFDAPASSTRPASVRWGTGHLSIVRVAWLLGRCVRREPVGYGVYRDRFNGSVHSFKGDLASLRRARIYRGDELLGS
jgi:hypothetical protein